MAYDVTSIPLFIGTRCGVNISLRSSLPHAYPSCSSISGVCPETRWVEGSNFVDIGFKIEPRTNRIIAMGALDNLVKGAAGQAVQNMNLLFGFEENEGLKIAPMFP